MEDSKQDAPTKNRKPQGFYKRVYGGASYDISPLQNPGAVIGAAIREGYTIKEIAKAIGVTRQTIYNWLDGKNPQFDQLRQLDRLHVFLKSKKNAK